MGHDVAQRFGTAMGQLHQVGAAVGIPLVHEPRPIGAVLGGKRNGRVGKVIELGQGSVDISLLHARRRRVCGCATEQEKRQLGFGLPQLVQQAPQAVAQVHQETAAAASCCSNHVDTRHTIAQGQAGLTHRLVERVGVRDLLHLAAQAGHEAHVVIDKGQAAEGAYALGLQRAWDRVELFARQPFTQMVEHAPAILAHDLQRHVINLAAAQGHLGSAAYRFLHGRRIRIDVEKA